ncbi:MAG TPA: class I SAM-dependent methyltransferase [Pyrinomonadaceae bacterium]|nr:class I SAM-dependent methyltransferase [Pyrinomonadaceae bacterium]
MTTNGDHFDPDVVKRVAIWDSTDLVVDRRCILCDYEPCREVAVRTDGLLIRECPNCALAFVDPRPSSNQLNRYYAEGYFDGAKDFFRGKDYCLERDRSIQAGLITGYREIVSHFKLKGKTVLDIGCASGALLYLLREQQAKEVIGLDSAEYPVSFGIENYGLDLRSVALESAQLPDSYFDLITLIDVIEHVENLNTFLDQLNRVIKPGGHVFIITPNYSAYALAGRQWSCLSKDFEHLQYFCEESLHRICSRFRWLLLKSWTDSVPFRIHEYPRLYKFGFHRLLHPSLALRNRISENRYKRAVKKQMFAGGSLNAVLRAPLA